MKRIILTFGLISIITVTSFGVSAYNQTDKIEASNSNPNKSKVEEVILHPDFITDVTDDKKLVGVSDNVFLGKVIKQTGTKSIEEYLPETQYSVEIIENIKGDLSGIVTVNQQGGYLEYEDGQKELVLFEGDELLVEGNTYLFSTRYLESENWYTLIPAYGNLTAETESIQDDLVENFNDALDEEIVPTELK
ncbi:hypothetical protein ACTQ5K_21355 [Niallia sp. Sow4_A1]|uniref:Uncharacterized protein n=1 Tax=Niallia hominis TaxID=3133173 RepID=A0ABV1F435_9BACI|nr:MULTISPECIES: hypothetical protein [Bacillaceae]MCF2649870.1 hypothetical protein [Niallia circulans]MCM3364778.1 hypothetical protein [Niallia sp. MER TA 168]CAI9393601.1 hypothetical protein BACSP_03595 [Bacillus sp. T2.9-1]